MHETDMTRPINILGTIQKMELTAPFGPFVDKLVGGEVEEEMTVFFPGKRKTYGSVTFFFARFLRDESLDKTMQKFPHRISIATRPIFEIQNMYPQVRY